MEVVTMSQLRQLVDAQGENCVSLFMSTYPFDPGRENDEVGLKNLVFTATERLVGNGMRRSAADEYLAPIAALPQSPSWRQRKQGLALFRSSEVLRTFWLATPLNECLVVGERFYVKPLLPVVSVEPEFFVLALSRNQVRLLKATSDGFTPVPLAGVSSGMDQTLNLEGADRGEQVHSGMRGDLGKQAGVFHGQGGRRDTVKDEFSAFCQLIDKSLQPILRDTPWPLILAGVEYELSLFREVCRYDRIMDEALSGGFDHLRDHELYERALPIAARYYDRAVRHSLDTMTNNRSLVSDKLEEIIPAVFQGKVDTLLVDPKAELFGRFDTERRQLEQVATADPALDLVELAAEQTILHRGNVWPAKRDELANGSPMRAILRF
jgi:hypothetical protein